MKAQVEAGTISEEELAAKKDRIDRAKKALEQLRSETEAAKQKLQNANK